MKSFRFKGVQFCNRSKALTCAYTCGKVCRIKYSTLGLKENIAMAWCDAETRSKTICLKLNSGRVEYLPYDQPLHIVGDPDYKAQMQLEHTLADINIFLKKKKISPRMLAHKTGLSLLQVQKALDPKQAIKNIPHLYNVASSVGLDLTLQTSPLPC